MTTDGNKIRHGGGGSRHSEALNRVLESLRGLRYGHIEIVVEEGSITGFERREKQRFERPKSPFKR